MDKSKMDLNSLDKEAEAAALLEIKNMFQRSGQLEKIDSLKTRIQRKKLSDEQLLKSALTNQLNSVGSGLQQLKSSLEDAVEVEVRIKNIQNKIKSVPKLELDLEEVKDENVRVSITDNYVFNITFCNDFVDRFSSIHNTSLLWRI